MSNTVKDAFFTQLLLNPSDMTFLDCSNSESPILETISSKTLHQLEDVFTWVSPEGKCEFVDSTATPKLYRNDI